MLSIISFLIILSVLVLVHELGHFWMGRKFGVKIEEFGLGYPPRALAKKIGETIYSLNWLPLGGFVKLLGENGEEEGKKLSKTELKRSFFTQKKRVRITILTAGVIMNFLLGVVLFAAIYTKIGIPEEVNYLKVLGIGEGSPAELAGIKAGDKIIGIENKEDVFQGDKKELTNRFIEVVNSKRGEEIKFILDENREIIMTPRLIEDIPEGQGALGVSITNVDLVQYPYWQRPFRGIWVGLEEAWAWGKDILVSLKIMVVKGIQGEAPKDVAGPVGIYQISKSVVEEGILTILQFVAILSINLSVLNLLPIPALDGGRLLFIAIETVFRKKVSQRIEQTIHLVGMIILLGLMALVTINDIRRLIG